MESDGAVYKHFQRYLEVIRFRASTNNLLVAASELKGRYWTGSLSFYDNIDTCSFAKPLSSSKAEFGIADATWLTDEAVVTVGDSKGVDYWSLHDNHFQLEDCTEEQHDGTVSSVSVNATGTVVASGSEDSDVRLWSAVDRSLRDVFSHHIDAVTCVRFSPTQPNCLLSCSRDGTVALCDDRTPSSLLSGTQLASLPTALAWQPGNDSGFVVGDESGFIGVYDIRGGSGVMVTGRLVHHREVTRLEFHPINTDIVASTSNDHVSVCVCDTSSQLQTIYSSTEHQDFARCSVWHSNSPYTLYTCGWDGKILRHSTGPVLKEMTSLSEAPIIAETPITINPQ